jgi:sugar phosphate isomerase/epimerase
MQLFKLTEIGITTQIIRRSKWYKDIKVLGFNTIEINRQNSVLYCNLYFLEKIKRYTRGCALSLHSATKGIFQDRRSFTEANLAMLLAEVDMCNILEAPQLVFHLTDGILEKGCKKKLGDIIDYASDHGVRMMYEPNSHMVADHSYDILETFPKIGYALDLGHLNCALCGSTLGCDMEQFIRQIRERVEYLHVSNNNGLRDEHISLGEGTLKWRRVLDLLNLSNVTKMIIEVRSMDRVEPTLRDLSDYLQVRYENCLMYN